MVRRLLSLGVLSSVLAVGLSAAPGNGFLQLHFMDVGQGDGALLVTPGGQTVLFDNGVFNQCTRPLTYLQARGVTQIDYQVASHYHADHIGCTEEILSVMPLQHAAYDRGGSFTSQTYNRYVSAVGAKRQTAPVGTSLMLDGGVELKFIAANGAGVSGADDENDLSVVVVVKYGAFEAVIAGDLSGVTDNGYRDIETTVAPLVGQVEVYKVNHHASRYSSNAAWLGVVRPRIGIISIGATNTFGHPTAEAMARLHAANVLTYWTSAGNGVAPTPGQDIVASDVVVEVAPGAFVFNVRANGATETYSMWDAPLAAPGPPTGLASSVAGSTVMLSWSAPVTGGVATGYIVEAAATPGSATIATLPTAQTSLTVPNVPNGTYYVRVRATNAEGTSAASNEVTVTVGPPPCSLPGAPANLASTVNGTTVTLTWTAPVSACAVTGFIVQAGSAPGQSNLAVLPVTTAGLIATAPPGAYFVRVLAVNAAGQGPPSPDILVAVGPTCIAPENPTGLSASTAGLSVTLTWTAPAGGGTPSAYRLEAGSSPGLADLAALSVPATTFSVTAPAGTYYVRVRTQNPCGLSGPSNEVVVTLTATPSGGIVISEFRTRGPAGANDEFIELRNTSNAPIAIAGWQVSGSNGSGGTQVRATIAGGIVLQPGCYYLLTNSNASGGYSGAVGGDQQYGVSIADDGGIALLNPSGSPIDAVGLSGGSAYGEGTRLPSFGTTNSDRSLVRATDTNNNAADFTNRTPSVPQNAVSSCSAQPDQP